MNRPKMLAWIAAALALAGVALLAVRHVAEKPAVSGPERPAPGRSARPDAPRADGRRQVLNPKGLRVRSDKPVIVLEEDDDDPRTPAEKALAARIEKALDDEDLKAAVDCAKEALFCPRTEIRQAMVDTLGWFDDKALAELTPFMADPDEDVRESAMNEWRMAVSKIENEAEKLGIVEVAMSILTDEDALEDISGEYIGADEKVAVESLVRLIASNGSKEGVAKAKETYEFVTGEEWVSAEAAAKWIAEEYEPPRNGTADQ